MSDCHRTTLCNLLTETWYHRAVRAEDVAETDGKAVIVFALRISEDDIDAESLARIKEIGAYIINDDISQIKHSLRRTRNYYLLDTNNSENLEAGLRIYQKYNIEHNDKVNM